MGASLRGLLLTLPAALAALGTVPDEADARRAGWYHYRREVTGAVPHVSPPAPPVGAAEPVPAPAPTLLKIPNAALEPANWSDLDGWAKDDHASAFATFYASCRPIVRSAALRTESSHRTQQAYRAEPPRRAEQSARNPVVHPPSASPPSAAALPSVSLPSAGDSRPMRVALEQVCDRAIKAGRLDPEGARRFFETNFVPMRIHKLGEAAGFLTGYYEPIVDGSRVPTREFTVPLYRRPPDLVAAGVPDGAAFPNTGRAFRRTESGELVPYYDRGEIEDGALDGQRLEICWLRSPTEALFIQIQGSARIRLEDGTMLRLNYDAHNGHAYVPVGRVLIERNLVSREDMSMQRIREWMHDNPDGAKDVRRQNRSVVFFRIVGLNDDSEALGAQGIPLSAGRSIAVDKALHVYGTPFFIEADLPLASARSQTPFRRTMIAQDTGSAIVGPARADLFFGAGDEAGQVAGRIKQPGRFTMLLPRELAPTGAGAQVPLPPIKPPLPGKPLTSQVAARSWHPAYGLPTAARESIAREPVARETAAREERRRYRRYWQ
jgi:membrane-bound lytic murein transglycosylase A